MRMSFFQMHMLGLGGDRESPDRQIIMPSPVESLRALRRELGVDFGNDVRVWALHMIEKGLLEADWCRRKGFIPN